MKNICSILAILALAVSCEEIAPTINPQMEVDTNICDKTVDVNGQERAVLMEEFTGVQCVNCPQGSETLQLLLDQHGDRLVGISIHAGEFAPPYPESTVDFRNPAADAIFDLLQVPTLFPNSAINRGNHVGDFLVVPGDGQWAGIVDTELEKPLVMRLGLAHEYNADTRELEVCAKMYPQEDFTADEILLTILIIENDIVDVQKTPSGKVPDYVHKHALRGAITNPTGNLITESITAGAEISNGFAFTLPDDWVAENCEIVAFVGKGGQDKEILQAVQVHLVE